MQVRQKNLVTKELIERLREKGLEAPAWHAVAKGLNRPRRVAYEVNLRHLGKYAGAQTLIVPGSVLGAGDLTTPLTVAALHFSQAARDKIQKAGGTCLSIDELVQRNPTGANVRIIG